MPNPIVPVSESPENARRFEGLMAVIDWIYAQPRGTGNEQTEEIFEETEEEEEEEEEDEDY